MGRRGLGNAAAIAKMWGFVALALGMMSFVQAYGFVRAQATRGTELSVEACNLNQPEEYLLDTLQGSARSTIENLTGLPRLDLSGRPVTIKSGFQGITLTTENNRVFRLSRQMVLNQRKRYFPLIGRALNPCANIPAGQEAYVLILSPQAIEELKTVIKDARVYCTAQSEALPIPGSG